MHRQGGMLFFTKRYSREERNRVVGQAGRVFFSTKVKTTTPTPVRISRDRNFALRAGLPFILFSILSTWVVSEAFGGRLRESEAAQGRVSKSVRQAALQEEHDEIVQRLNKIAKQDFDNTKRIKRPEEILEERRKAREKRNAWHRRAYRWIRGIPPQKDS